MTLSYDGGGQSRESHAGASIGDEAGAGDDEASEETDGRTDVQEAGRLFDRMV
jgi:hypothetical protein